MHMFSKLTIANSEKGINHYRYYKILNCSSSQSKIKYIYT